MKLVKGIALIVAMGVAGVASANQHEKKPKAKAADTLNGAKSDLKAGAAKAKKDAKADAKKKASEAMPTTEGGTEHDAAPTP